MSKPTPRVSDGHTRNIYYMYSGRLLTKYRQQNCLTDLHVHPESQTPSSVPRTGVCLVYENNNNNNIWCEQIMFTIYMRRCTMSENRNASLSCPQCVKRDHQLTPRALVHPARDGAH